MVVKQIADLVNTALAETTGVSVVVEEDLSNLVDAGEAVFNSGAVDNYARAITNAVGKTIFVTRVYQGRTPSIRKDGWTYGSVLRKIRVVPMEATENETWQLTKGASYDPNIFNPPEVHEKFFNSKVTFELPISLTDIQIRESFQSAEQMNSFLAMIETMILNTMTKDMENLSIRAINNLIGETIYSETDGGSTSGRSGNKAINLLYLYNTKYNKTLTAADAVTDGDFIRFAVYTMRRYQKYLAGWSKVFNIGGTDKFTPMDRLHTVLLADFESAASVYLYDANGQFKDESIRLPEAETVPYWQGDGTKYDFESISKIFVKTSENHEVEAGGILGVMFDDEAVMINNSDRRTTTGYNPRGEFYNYWHKMDAQYLNDFDENFIVFYVA